MVATLGLVPFSASHALPRPYWQHNTAYKDRSDNVLTSQVKLIAIPQLVAAADIYKRTWNSTAMCEEEHSQVYDSLSQEDAVESTAVSLICI